jgi:hypothetical protein
LNPYLEAFQITQRKAIKLVYLVCKWFHRYGDVRLTRFLLKNILKDLILLT